MDELRAGLEHVRQAPAGEGRLAMIVRRPAVDGREVLGEGILEVDGGLLGDSWRERGSRSTPDGAADPAKQLTVMNARAIALVAGGRRGWELAGDQLYVDFDIGHANLPAGSRLRIGEAVLEVSAAPHRGCAKFSARFGEEAVRFVNSPDGTALRLRGLNARVLVPGTVRVGDPVRREAAAADGAAEVDGQADEAVA